MVYVELVLRHTPLWVYGVFALLLYLGLSRFRVRRVSLCRAMAAPIAFLLWSLASALGAASASPRGWMVALIWLTSFLAGWWSCRIRVGGAAPEYLGGGVFLFAATAVPLIAYMLLFWSRFAMEVWAAFDPPRAGALLVAGIVASAGPAGRTCGDFLRLLALRTAAPRLSAVAGA